MAISVNAGYVRGVLPPRNSSGYKGSFGQLSIVAGSSMYPGAAVLAAHGAMRAGAGMVQLAGVPVVCNAAAAQLPGCVLAPLNENKNGCIAAGGLSAALWQNPSAALIGCGLGKSEECFVLVAELLASSACPVVLDADALNSLTKTWKGGKGLTESGAALLKNAKEPLVITPHVGEMARLCGVDADAVLKHTQKYAAAFGSEYNCTVVLKSHKTVVASPEGEIYLLDIPENSGLAKAGSGDVLAGIIASLLAQGAPPAQAAAAGVWLHAAAGKAAKKKLGERAMLPQDLPLFLTDAFKRLGE